MTSTERPTDMRRTVRCLSVDVVAPEGIPRAPIVLPV